MCLDLNIHIVCLVGGLGAALGSSRDRGVVSSLSGSVSLQSLGGEHGDDDFCCSVLLRRSSESKYLKLDGYWIC